ncbi:MAG: EscU/YscU/HrcU family type III secretion system export apparatus switch protein [Bdellovibrionota bacterium]
MSDWKGYPPSEQKLKKLRESGVIPKSGDVLLFAVLLGALLGVRAVMSFGWRAFAESCWKTNCVFERSDLLTPGATLARTVLALSARLMLPAVVMVLLFGLLQTRFLLAPHLVRIDFGRLARGVAALVGFRKQLISAVLQVLKFAAWAAVCYLLLSALLRWVEAAPELEIRPHEMAEKGSSVWRSVRSGLLTELAGTQAHLSGVAMAGIGFTFALGVLSYFVAFLSFRQEHAMSRGEIEAESRELEPSPEVQQAIRDLREPE